MTIFGNSQLTFGVTGVRGSGGGADGGDLDCQVQPEFKRDLTSSTLQAKSVSGKIPRLVGGVETGAKFLASLAFTVFQLHTKAIRC